MADDSDEWVSPREAIRLVKPLAGTEESAQQTIVAYARDGLFRSRAAKLIEDELGKDDVELLAWFWKGIVLRSINWNTGYFGSDHTTSRGTTPCKAYGVQFLRADIEKLFPELSDVEEPAEPHTAKTRGSQIFIGHGHSPAWLKLQQFIVGGLNLPCDEFNAVPSAGIPIAVRLEQMLDDAAFAFLVLTAEDESADGKMQARMNVVHEAGLFQGRLGFRKAIVLLEEGCEKFSNIEGLGDIRFPQGKIEHIFEQVRRVLEREGIIQKS